MDNRKYNIITKKCICYKYIDKANKKWNNAEQNFILFTIDRTKKYMLSYILIREVYYGNKNNI